MIDKHRGSQTEVSAELRAEARPGAMHAHALARDDRGDALIEFALLVPILFSVLLGIIVFGIAFNNYVTLTNATNLGAEALSISRGQTTNPCTTASAAVYAAAPRLTQANLKFAIEVNGAYVAGSAATPVASPTCATATLVATQTASVTVQYPCNVKVFSYDPAPGCTLTAQTAEAIQ
ncbi:MAG: TadE/TadG family type IV pilus assembly protein [Terriglobia bacterium]